MSTKKCLHLLEKNPIIAAIRDPKDIYDAVASPCQIVFLLTGNIYNLKTMIDYINVAGKYAFVHLDLLKGYGQDHYFVKYLKEELHPTGIISTRNSLITIAKRENLMTIQRLFLLDSSAMDVTINAARKIKPDAVEVLPGLVSKVIRKVNAELSIPIITGGFIETEEEVKSCIQAGSISSSTSYKPLWEKFDAVKIFRENFVKQNDSVLK